MIENRNFTKALCQQRLARDCERSDQTKFYTPKAGLLCYARKDIKIVSIFLIMLGFMLADCKCGNLVGSTNPKNFFSKPTHQENLLLVYTTSMNGYYEPCGCTTDPLGGISRIAALVDAAKSMYGSRVVFLDAGNLLFEHESVRSEADLCQDVAKTKLLLENLATMGLSATSPGPTDDVRGVDWRNEQFSKYAIQSLENEGKQIDVNGIKVGVFALRLFSAAEAPKLAAKAKESIAQLRADGAKIVIVLAQAPTSYIKEALWDLNTVDMVIAGYEPGEVPLAPERLGSKGPWLLSAGKGGQYLGAVEIDVKGIKPGVTLELDDTHFQKQSEERILKNRMRALEERVANETDNQKKSFLKDRIKKAKEELAAMENIFPEKTIAGPSMVVKAIPISRSIEPKEDVQNAVNAYEKSIPEIVASCEKDIVCPEALAGEPKYVGAQTCKQCHAEAFSVWEKSIVTIEATNLEGKIVKRREGHVKAWETLVEAGKDKDRSCVGCHSAGFMQPGGFCKVSDAERFTGVQCESCHGPGSKHAETGNKKFIKREVPESHCRSCHHVPHIESADSFVYEERLKKILGPGHGEMLLKKLEHQ